MRWGRIDGLLADLSRSLYNIPFHGQDERGVNTQSNQVLSSLVWLVTGECDAMHDAFEPLIVIHRV
ncbi:MAG TPA: hypothetical protein DIT99_07315, partial [Candidatus Latescibacteria bacterium]|nr:hypothetical protein [Candidatus Latescibacterota bacterium]